MSFAFVIDPRRQDPISGKIRKAGEALPGGIFDEAGGGLCECRINGGCYLYNFL